MAMPAGEEKKLDTEAQPVAAARDYESEYSGDTAARPVDAFEQAKAHAGEDYMEYRTMGWPAAAALITAETVALGILSFPLTYYRLGMFGGTFATVGLATLAWQTGYVLVQFKAAHPQVMNFADAGGLMFGKPGYVILGCALALKCTLVAGSHCLSGAIAFDNMTGHATCNAVWALVVGIISFLLALPRTFEKVSYISYASVTSILIAVFITIIAVPTQSESRLVPPGGEPIRWKAFEYHGFQETINAVTNIIFAYGGHVAILSFCSEMKKPEDFTKSLALVQLLSTTFYVLTGAIIYRFGGQYVTSPALTMTARPVRITAYAIAMISIIVAGVVASYVGGKFIYHTIFRGTRWLSSGSFRAWTYWALVMAGVWSAGFIIAELIPFFSDLLSIISSILTIWFTYGLSGVIGIWQARKDPEGLFGTKKRIALFCVNCFTLTFAAVFMPLGMWAAISSIAHNYKVGAYGRPFGCG